MTPSLRGRLLAAAVRWPAVKRALYLPGGFRGHPADGRPPGRVRRRYPVRREWRHGWPVYAIGPRGRPPGDLQVLFLHGGGYVGELLPIHWRYAARLADALGARVLLPLYPLAPAGSAATCYPTLLEIYRDLTGTGGRLVLAADSAGAAMCLVLAGLARDGGLPQPAALVLLSPWLDAGITDPATLALAGDDPVLTPAGMAADGRAWAGDLPVDHPWVSPIHADLTGLAPITVLCGTRDLMLADARRLASRASVAGQPCDLHEYPGMVHDFMLLPLPEARSALARVVAAVAGR